MRRFPLWFRLVVFLLGSVPGLLALARAGDPAQVIGLRTEYLFNPDGIDTPQPRLSWQLASEHRGVRQLSYRLLVASDRQRLKPGEADLWDPGWVDRDETVNVPYAGKPLRSGQVAFWRVEVTTTAGEAVQRSAPARWSMGLLQPADWTAKWISFRDDSPLATNRNALHLPPARHYRRSFEAPRAVRRAVLYGSALGLVEFHLNGRRVGDSYFEPGWADYHRRGYYRTHDVTALMQRGDNTLGAIVADGWYAGYVGYGLLVGYGPYQTGRAFYGKTPALLAQLEIEYTDGSRATIGTDATWQVSGDGPLREADLIMGEAFDAQRERPDWCRAAGAADWHWENAIPAEANGSVKAPYSDTLGKREVELGFQAPPRLQAYAAPPIRVTGELKPQQITEPKPGTYIFDLGQNFAGIVRLKVKGPAGTKLQLRYGEMLHPDGRLMTENLRRARATDFYTLRGDPQGETWQPRFTYHGFQFVEVSGLTEAPDLDAVTGLVLNNDTTLASEFACSDEVMTRFWKNTQWTQRANFIEMPTDCPQRDERLGWMGDAQIYVRTATFNADVAAFYTKWLDDVEEAQRDFGAYPDYCPYPMAHGAPGQTFGTAWTDAGIICPWTIWQVYGDTRVIERHWASMTRFMEWRKKRSPDGGGRGDGNTWGDWLNVNETTPIEFIDAAYYLHDAKLMSDMARAIGRAAEAGAYAELQARLTARFAKDYARADGSLSVETQTAYVLATRLAELPGAGESGLVRRLVDRIVRNEHRMSTGFLGTKHLLPALTAGGFDDLACRLFQSRRFPSWGYEVMNGATTVWERWDSFTKEHGFNGSGGNQNASMNSFSHYSFGAVMEWGFRDLAGIDTDGPGYRRIVIRPHPPAPGSNPENRPIDWVRASYRSIRGLIQSEWKRGADNLEMNVVVPANTTATVYVPAKGADRVRESGQPLGQTPGVKVLRDGGDAVVLEVGSGRYRFSSSL